ncbi:protein kinase domain-containing protein [Fimbriiglobus ruber]|uniref:Serine/threonine protein kinase n=1 Tax=Fimbriiglobus ruber TaxID=1908690 RepID=A0A225DFH0_9BACT|nr:serine/threonine-protein kinase [Fimbriiglobus ruber]OWK40232.1 serine/threonine protein kinase [Fimbriiglobus ruber]
MNPTPTENVAVEDDAAERARRADAIKEAWHAGQKADARAALDANPDLLDDRAIAIDLAYEEFCTREEAGEEIEPGAFCARFPYRSSIRRLISVHRFLDDHPDALDGAAVPASWPAVGELVGDFQVGRELGRGGFSRVYLGLETTAGRRPVALKVSGPRASLDAETLGPLSHPHLISVLSAPRVGDRQLFAMPFVGTATLEDVLECAWPGVGADPPRTAEPVLAGAVRGRRATDPPFTSCPPYPVDAGMSYEQGIAAVASGLANVMAFLHDRDVAHRDLKPSNVLLGPTGHPYLLDFNLSTGPSAASRVGGTLPYMAPEHLTAVASPGADGPTDWRPADVYSFGIILFELLTGRHPFGAYEIGSGVRKEELAKILLAAQTTGFPAPRKYNPHISEGIESLIARCLSAAPADRPTAPEIFARLAPNPPAQRPTGLRWRTLTSFVLATLCGFSLSPWDPRAPAPNPSPFIPPGDEPPPDPLNRGLALYRQGEVALAAAEFRRVAKQTNDGKAYAYAAYCFAVKKNWMEAEFEATQAIEAGYRTPVVYADRAYIRLRLGQFEKVRADCDDALHLDKNMRAARLTRATVNLRLVAGKIGKKVKDETVADIRQVLIGSPIDAETWFTAAQIFMLAPAAAGNLKDEAADAVSKAIAAGKKTSVIGREPILAGLKGHPLFDHALTQEPGLPIDAPELQLPCPIP